MQLIVSFDKRTKQGLAKSVWFPAMKTTMAPSSALYSTELGAASDATKVVTQGIIGQVHPEEPLLYLIPDKLKPTYRPLPLFAQASIFLLSTWISAMSTWRHLTFLQPLIILRGWRPVASPALLGAFVAKVSLWSKAMSSPSPVSIKLTHKNVNFIIDSSFLASPLYVASRYFSPAISDLDP